MTTTETTRRTLLALAASVLALAGAAEARTPALVSLEVVDRETGQPLRVWRHEGRLFVAGAPGARYSLRVTNRTDGRVLVVMSVDGVNVLTGETAAYGQRGYVFDPYQSYDVSGWRKSETEVAAFTFAALSRSYAARTGRPGDVGVIGVAAFRERAYAPAQVSPPRPQARPREEAEAGGRASPSAPAADLSEGSALSEWRRDEKLGTAHGAREWSAATVVPFERATRYPQLVRRIEYDTYERLVAAGVAPPRWAPARRPRPFPSNGDGAGYAPDPPGWP